MERRGGGLITKSDRQRGGLLERGFDRKGRLNRAFTLLHANLLLFYGVKPHYDLFRVSFQQISCLC